MRPPHRCLLLWLALALPLPAMAAEAPRTDRDWALAADAAWRPAWIAHARRLARVPGRIPGFVLQIGDSLTHANPYGQWPRALTGASPAERATGAWLHLGAVGRAADAATCADGFALAQIDCSRWRGLTALSGETTADLLAGTGVVAGDAMPACADAAPARALLADGRRLPASLRLATILAAFPGAQAAVVLLGTNDVRHQTPAAAFHASLDRLIAACEAQGVLVVLTTLPPQPTSQGDAGAAALSAVVTACAQAHALPLIPLREEILRRRPGGSWQGTLVQAGDVHLSARAGTWNAASDPYAGGGNALTGTTGPAVGQVGYLLRSWLTLQKLTQLRQALAAHEASAP